MRPLPENMPRLQFYRLNEGMNFTICRQPSDEPLFVKYRSRMDCSLQAVFRYSGRRAALVGKRLTIAISAVSLFNAALLEVNHAHDHRAVWVEGQIAESPSSIECAHMIVDRMRDNAKAADFSRGSERRAKSEE
jgi:hypothetical protein